MFACKQIARPIALDTIKRNINSGVYRTLDSFEDDFELMFENAKQYNAEGSDVYLDAEELQVIEVKIETHCRQRIYILCTDILMHDSLCLLAIVLEGDWQGWKGSSQE